MNKSTLYGIIGSFITNGLVFIILWFYVIPVTITVQKEELEGIMVSFGDSPDGSGMNDQANGNQDINENQETPVQPAATPVQSAPKTTPTKSTSSNYLTSNDAESIAIAEQKKKDKLAKDNLEKQRLEDLRVANEKKKREQDAINSANNTMSGLFGTGGGSGSGTTTGNTMQGNPAGKGVSGGNSWSLTGRSLSGRMVKPSYDNDVEGKITVSIRVDANGNVTSASIGSPTTISDQATRNAAIAAAKSTRFTSGDGVASGSITYNFNLN